MASVAGSKGGMNSDLKERLIRARQGGLLECVYNLIMRGMDNKITIPKSYYFVRASFRDPSGRYIVGAESGINIPVSYIREVRDGQNIYDSMSVAGRHVSIILDEWGEKKRGSGVRKVYLDSSFATGGHRIESVRLKLSPRPISEVCNVNPDEEWNTWYREGILEQKDFEELIGLLAISDERKYTIHGGWDNPVISDLTPYFKRDV